MDMNFANMGVGGGYGGSAGGSDSTILIIVVLLICCLFMCSSSSSCMSLTGGLGWYFWNKSDESSSSTSSDVQKTTDQIACDDVNAVTGFENCGKGMGSVQNSIFYTSDGSLQDWDASGFSCTSTTECATKCKAAFNCKAIMYDTSGKKCTMFERRFGTGYVSKDTSSTDATSGRYIIAEKKSLASDADTCSAYLNGNDSTKDKFTACRTGAGLITTDFNTVGTSNMTLSACATGCITQPTCKAFSYYAKYPHDTKPIGVCNFLTSQFAEFAKVQGPTPTRFAEMADLPNASDRGDWPGFQLGSDYKIYAQPHSFTANKKA